MDIDDAVDGACDPSQRPRPFGALRQHPVQKPPAARHDRFRRVSGEVFPGFTEAVPGQVIQPAGEFGPAAVKARDAAPAAVQREHVRLFAPFAGGAAFAGIGNQAFLEEKVDALFDGVAGKGAFRRQFPQRRPVLPGQQPQDNPAVVQFNIPGLFTRLREGRTCHILLLLSVIPL